MSVLPMGALFALGEPGYISISLSIYISRMYISITYLYVRTHICICICICIWLYIFYIWQPTIRVASDVITEKQIGKISYRFLVCFCLDLWEFVWSEQDSQKP